MLVYVVLLPVHLCPTCKFMHTCGGAVIIAAIAGYAGAIMTGVEIPYLSDLKIPYIDKFIQPPPPEPVKLTPVKKTVTSRFLVNKASGTLFVIKGDVINQSAVSCKNITLKGTLITKEKKKAQSSAVLCGNILVEERLKTMDIKAINTLLTNSTSNSEKLMVAPGKTIPFLLVFADLPENLETFTVSVTDFERVPIKK